MKTELNLARAADEIHVRPIEGDGDHVRVEVSFSSEFPVDRAFGREVLDHSPGAIDFSRLIHGAPFLVNHNPDDQVGVVESAVVRDARGYALIRFSRTDRGQAIATDLLDGIRTGISVGYRVDDIEQEDHGVYRVSRWTPFEISTVSIPADPSVGFGRSGFEDRFGDPAVAFRAFNPTFPKESKMTDESDKLTRSDKRGIKAERERVAAILKLGNKFDMTAEAAKAVQRGTTLQEFQGEVLDARERQAFDLPPTTFGDPYYNDAVRSYSITKAIAAAAKGDWSEAGLEREMHQELERQTGKTASGVLVPLGALQQRDMSYAGEGSNLVATQHMPSEFIDVLYNNSAVMRAGARNIQGLQGNVSIPKKTGSTTAYWFTGDGSDEITESDITLTSLTMEPHALAGLTTYTHRMLRQGTPEVEQIIRNDLAAVLGVELDRAALNGNGTGPEPLGLLGTAGVNADTYTGSPDYADVLDMMAALGDANADSGPLSFITTPALAYALANVAIEPGSGKFLHEIGNGSAEGAVGSILRRPVYTTKNMPTGALLLGRFPDLLIGNWGVLEIQASGDTGNNFKTGSVSVRAILDADITVRYPEAFAVRTPA